MAKRIHPRTEIGRVHLTVSDLDRALAFYQGVLGFELAQRLGPGAAFLSADGSHPHIGLNTWETRRDGQPDSTTARLNRFAIRYPDRAALGDALQRLRTAGVPLDGAMDHGVSEALYVRDPDGHALELYWDRPHAEWPRAKDGSLEAIATPLDLEGLARVPGEQPARESAEPEPSPYAPMSESMRQMLRELRGKLLQLHKVLLDDTRRTYEMDRGRVGSTGNLLQLVINDPWFAWLHSLSELVVRIDQLTEAESPATDADAVSLFEEVEKLLVASESGHGFARRYFEALQRQPAVVLAHADVRRQLKEAGR